MIWYLTAKLLYKNRTIQLIDCLFIQRNRVRYWQNENKILNLVHLEPLAQHKKEIGGQTVAKFLRRATSTKFAKQTREPVLFLYSIDKSPPCCIHIVNIADV